MPERHAASETARLYRTYGPAVYRRCVWLLRDRELARDATQEVFLRLLRELDARAGPDAVLAWIYRVATNHCLNLLRSARRHAEGAGPVELDVAEARDGGDPEARRLVARQILDRFDEKTRVVAVGVLVDGMEHEELARVLKVSRRTVTRRLARFLTHARQLLDDREG